MIVKSAFLLAFAMSALAISPARAARRVGSPLSGSRVRRHHRPHDRGLQVGLPAAGEGAPGGAPNVLLILTDDVGFGASSTFGGPVPTPTLDIARRTRPQVQPLPHDRALLADARGADHRAQSAQGAYRHHHGAEPRLSRATIPSCRRAPARSARSCAATATTPHGSARTTTCRPGSRAPPGPFDLWPTGLGFEYFYGFIGGDTDQWDPTVFENTIPVEPKER